MQQLETKQCLEILWNGVFQSDIVTGVCALCAQLEHSVVPWWQPGLGFVALLTNYERHFSWSVIWGYLVFKLLISLQCLSMQGIPGSAKKSSADSASWSILPVLGYVGGELFQKCLEIIFTFIVYLHMKTEAPSGSQVFLLQVCRVEHNV